MTGINKNVNRITAVVALSLSLGGVSSAVAGEEYGVLMKTLSNPFWGAMGLGVEEGAKAAGVAYFVQAVESDQAAESQLNVCNTMLERKPVAMITAAINSTNLLPCLKAAQEAGIKVVDLDGNLDPAILEKEGIDITFRIGSDNVAAGGNCTSADV
jgi:ABC-type sugar transport system substrate-binding protein